MGIASALYHTVAKRTSTFVLAIGVSAFVFERGKNISKSETSCQCGLIRIAPGQSKYNNFNDICLAAFDTGADWIWETNNKGKLWKDIKHKYEAED